VRFGGRAGNALRRLRALAALAADIMSTKNGVLVLSQIMGTWTFSRRNQFAAPYMMWPAAAKSPITMVT